MRQTTRCLLTLTLVTAGFFLLAPRATAAFKLRVDNNADGSFETVVVDNGAGDSDMTVGVINFSSPVGAFNVFVSVGTSKPILTNGEMDLLQLTINSFSAGKLAIELTDTDFTPAPSNPYQFSVGGTTTAPLALQEFEAGGGSSNVEFDLSTSTGALTPTATVGTAFAAGGLFATPTADPYSLTIRAVIEHTAAGQITSFDAHLTPTPAPAGLVLFATAAPVVALGAWLRRRNKAQAPTA